MVKKINLVIDGKNIVVDEGTTILDAAKANDIKIPTLCYLKEINEVGACRLCIVEIEGCSKLRASCNTYCEEGMIVHTNSPRVLTERKINLSFILSNHRDDCLYCTRKETCTLKNLSTKYSDCEELKDKKYDNFKWDTSLPLIRDNSKCVKCMRCINICNKVQSLKVWKLQGTGSHTKIGVRDGVRFKDVNCSLCGQCITHCPVGALYERDDSSKVMKAIADPEKIVLFQVAPAVRSDWAYTFNLPKGKATEKLMAAAIKALGADYVFDTNFSADLTIMEEGSELISKIKDGSLGKVGPYGVKWPMFTSCCPGWVRFLKLEYPELVPYLSTAKSPQQMFGAVAKSYYASILNVDPEKIFSVSIMPCTAKKYECDVEAVNSAKPGIKDVDVVLTTREFAKLVKNQEINLNTLEERDFDSPLGAGTGAAVIFGATGGVLEAALRSAYYLLTKKNPPVEAFKDVRAKTYDNNESQETVEDTATAIREKTFEIEGLKLTVAVTSSLGSARKLIESIKKGEAHYDFVEIMACPGGCAGGGGQPFNDGLEKGKERGEVLYQLDRENTLRFSHENPAVLTLYKDFMGEPLSHKAHVLLHTDQTKWKL